MITISFIFIGFIKLRPFCLYKGPTAMIVLHENKMLFSENKNCKFILNILKRIDIVEHQQTDLDKIVDSSNFNFLFSYFYCSVSWTFDNSSCKESDISSTLFENDKMTNRGFHKKSFYCLKVKHIFYETNSSVGEMIKLYNLTMEETQRQNESYEFTFHSDLFFYFYSHSLIVPLD